MRLRWQLAAFVLPRRLAQRPRPGQGRQDQGFRVDVEQYSDRASCSGSPGIASPPARCSWRCAMCAWSRARGCCFMRRHADGTRRMINSYNGKLRSYLTPTRHGKPGVPHHLGPRHDQQVRLSGVCRWRGTSIRGIGRPTASRGRPPGRLLLGVSRSGRIRRTPRGHAGAPRPAPNSGARHPPASRGCRCACRAR